MEPQLFKSTFGRDHGGRYHDECWLCGSGPLIPPRHFEGVSYRGARDAASLHVLALTNARAIVGLRLHTRDQGLPRRHGRDWQRYFTHAMGVFEGKAANRRGRVVINRDCSPRCQASRLAFSEWSPRADANRGGIDRASLSVVTRRPASCAATASHRSRTWQASPGGQRQ